MSFRVSGLQGFCSLAEQLQTTGGVHSRLGLIIQLLQLLEFGFDQTSLIINFSMAFNMKRMQAVMAVMTLLISM
jgi:hypothetical protein